MKPPDGFAIYDSLNIMETNYDFNHNKTLITLFFCEFTKKSDEH